MGDRVRQHSASARPRGILTTELLPWSEEYAPYDTAQAAPTSAQARMISPKRACVPLNRSSLRWHCLSPLFIAIVLVPLHRAKRATMSLAHRFCLWLSTSVQSTFGYPVRVPGSPPISDEVQLTSYLIQTPDLSQTIKAFGSDSAVMLAVIARCGPAERGSIRSVLKVVHGTEYMKVRDGQSSPRTPRNLRLAN